jgi:hypothetical protein
MHFQNFSFSLQVFSLLTKLKNKSEVLPLVAIAISDEISIEILYLNAITKKAKNVLYTARTNS